jgi:hypothetical protein
MLLIHLIMDMVFFAGVWIEEILGICFIFWFRVAWVITDVGITRTHHWAYMLRKIPYHKYYERNATVFSLWTIAWP